MGVKHLNKKKLEQVTDRLWMVSGSLKGISGLMTQDQSEHLFSDGSIYGLGQMMELFSKELRSLEDILRCGYDSVAKNEDQE